MTNIYLTEADHIAKLKSAQTDSLMADEAISLYAALDLAHPVSQDRTGSGAAQKRHASPQAPCLKTVPGHVSGTCRCTAGR